MGCSIEEGRRLLKPHLHLARGSKDLGGGGDCHKVQLEDILPVCNEGGDANLEGWMNAGGCVCRPTTHDTLRKAYITSHTSAVQYTDDLVRQMHKTAISLP